MKVTVNVMTEDDVEVHNIAGEWPVSSLMAVMDKLYFRMYRGEVKIVTLEVTEP